MVTKMELELYKTKSIKETDQATLKDLATVSIDRNKSVLERITAFMEELDNPYLFKVGNVPVKVEFSNDAPTLQQCLENFLIKKI